jgi:hypothetical protein
VEALMGIDPNTLPEWAQEQIRRKEGKKPANAEPLKAKAVPHDGRMNKTEQAYSGHLEKLKLEGSIRDWRHEPFNIRLAKRTFYKPDFVVVTAQGYIEVHEVKGRWMDDALVKIKVAADQLPWFTFVAVRHEAGTWKTRTF